MNVAEEELAERLARAEDALEAVAGWWRVNGHLYLGTTQPPHRLIAEVLPHRRQLERETYRRRAARRERPTAEGPLPGNLRLPLG
jgi:hypothetical protein